MASLVSKEAMRRFVVLGFPRSGTTLLSRILDAHPDISCPPETNLLSAAGRFLHEQTRVEGPPIGVLSGLGFLGLEPEAVYSELRNMVFGLHERISGGKPVWVEKTATDIFHIERLEPLLSGHVRFIALIRNPLDVIASNHDLSEVMGGQLEELFEKTRGINGHWDALAHAWMDRIDALLPFVERQGDACHVLRYEALLEKPEETIAGLFEFMAVSGSAADLLADMFSSDSRMGLGDFNIHTTDAILPPRKDSWRKRIPPAATARIVALLADQMKALGYTVPKVRSTPNRAEAIREFQMAAKLKQAISRNSSGGS